MASRIALEAIAGPISSASWRRVTPTRRLSMSAYEPTSVITWKAATATQTAFSPYGAATRTIRPERDDPVQVEGQQRARLAGRQHERRASRC